MDNGKQLPLMITSHVILGDLHLQEEMIMKYGFFIRLFIFFKVLILEKAWAKLFGSYERIESGLAREALNCLTGAPTEFIFMDYPEDEL